MDQVLRDTVGQTVKKGQIVTYPGRQSSSLWMNTGIVRVIEQVNGHWRLMVDRPVERRKYLRNEDGEICGYESTFRLLMVTLTTGCERLTVTSMTLKQFLKQYKIGEKERVIYKQVP